MTFLKHADPQLGSSQDSWGVCSSKECGSSNNPAF